MQPEHFFTGHDHGVHPEWRTAVGARDRENAFRLLVLV
jgi:hypothetical protein